MSKNTFRVSSNRAKAVPFFAHIEKEEITPTNIFLRVSPVPENICLQCGGSVHVEIAALRRRLFSGSTKTKTCQNLELLLGDLFEVGKEIGCRNCAEYDETLTKKIFNVRRTSQTQTYR